MQVKIEKIFISNYHLKCLKENVYYVRQNLIDG